MCAQVPLYSTQLYFRLDWTGLNYNLNFTTILSTLALFQFHFCVLVLKHFFRQSFLFLFIQFLSIMSGGSEKHQDAQLPKLHNLSSFSNQVILAVNSLIVHVLPLYIFSEMKGLELSSSLAFVLPMYALCSVVYWYLLTELILSKYKSLTQSMPKSGSGSSIKERSKMVESMSLCFSVASLNATYVLSFLLFAYGLTSPLPKLYNYLASTSLPLAILFYFLSTVTMSPMKKNKSK